MARIYWSVAHPMSGRVTNPHPVVKEEGANFDVAYDKITVPLPKDRELIKQYKKIKNDFIDGKINDWIIELGKIKERKTMNRLDLEPVKKYILQHPKEFVREDGKIDAYAIQLKFNIGENTSRVIKRFIQNEIIRVSSKDNNT